MNQRRTLREKIILALAGSLVFTYAFVEYVGEPLYRKQKSQEQKIESKILFITKYHEILNQKEYYRKKEQANGTLATQLEKLFLTPAQPALAAAGLQKLLDDMARKHRISLVQAKTEQVRYTEGLLTVPVRITVKSSLERLSRFIQSIENDQKYLVIEELVIRRINKQEPEQLESRLLVNGFIQQRKTKKIKAT